MNIYRQLERALHKCPEVNCDDYNEYPLVDDNELNGMDVASFSNSEVSHAFFYVSKSLSGRSFVSIYVWDQMLYPDCYKRFVICDGFRLSEPDEDLLVKYVIEARRGILITGREQLEYLENKIPKTFAGWNYHTYSSYRLDKVLSHLYFASHKSGCREMLFKCGLDNIAISFESISEVNLLATSPEKMFETKTPLRLLRILNDSELVHNLFAEDSLQQCREIYYQYSAYLPKGYISSAQWSYLEALYYNNDIFMGGGFNRTLFNHLEYRWVDADLLEKYSKFYELRNGLVNLLSDKAILKRIKLPPVERLDSMLASLQTMKRLLTSPDMINKKIEMRARLSILEYVGGKYSIVQPRSVEEMCFEAIMQGNCLMDYVQDYADGETVIVFLRRNEKINSPYVTIEISDFNVQQVRGKFNSLCDVDVYMFLEKYAAMKGIMFDPSEIVMDEIDWECDDISDALLDYLADYDKRHAMPIFPCDEVSYVQLTLEDCFPTLLIKDENLIA